MSEAAVYVPNEVGLWRTVGLLANGGACASGFASAVGAFDVKRRASITRGREKPLNVLRWSRPADSDYLIDETGECRPRTDRLRDAGLGMAVGARL